MKHFRMNISDIKIEQHFDESMSSLSSSKYIHTINSIVYFKLDNDDMESSKRRSIFISLIFILKSYIFTVKLKIT